ncbi:MAG TPA: DsbC family protein [Gammaproteobacteria bacterium]
MKLFSRLPLMMLAALLAAASAPFGLAHANEAANEADIKQLKQALPNVLPAAANAEITASPVAGLYQVVAGGQVLYMTRDAAFVLDGDLYNMQTRTNLTENARGAIRLEALNELGEKNMIVYQPKGEVKHTITVFTDIYCPYCVRLHNEVEQYLSNGVKVRYIFVPFKGPKSVEASVSVWCAKDQNEALSLAKAGEDIEQRSCNNPVKKHQALAAALGIRGTPAIMLENGQLMPGYVPAAKLIEQLNTL